ncbi:MAG: hypothetical protein IJX89_00735 [Alphaproteobacteria bacterium]|nr:hypothetical protein [Alphaproteobacteria bacterium]
MKKLFIIAGCIVWCACPADGALNCCASCPYNQTESQCTENCCTEGTTVSAPDENHIILETTNTLTVTCATSRLLHNTVVCSTKNTCKCEQGYYGTPSYSFGLVIGESGSCSGTCTRCPSSDGVYGTTAAAGATSITECYIPSGTTFSDDTGSGIYTDSCHYTE